MTVTDNERARSTAVRKGIGQAFEGDKKIVQKSDRSTSVGVTKVAILVAGMHRSGTSATTRFLSILGCTLPKIVSGAALDNERGFWETPVIRDLNEQILASAGSAWDDWEAIDSRWYNSLVADRFREQAQTVLESEFGDSRLFVLKDPRICRLLPFWIEAVRSFGAEPLVVSPIRNPLDIAKSLEERNGIDPSIGLLIWLRHLLDAEVASRDLKRAYLRYEHLLFEPHKVADGLSDTLGVVWPKHSTDTDMKTEEFLSPTLHHHQSEDASFLANPRLSNWLRSSFDIFDRWACGKVRKTDIADLNRIKLAFDKAMPAFGRAVSVGFKATRELGSAQERLVERDQRIEELSSEFGSAQERLVERDQRIEVLSSEFGSAQERLVERDQRIGELSSEFGSAQERLVERDQRIEELSSEFGSAQETLVERDERITQLDAALYEIRISTCWRLTLPIRYLGIYVKRAIRIIRYFFLVLWTPKAIKGILQRFRIVLRQEGVTGIGRRLHTVFMHETHSARTISSLADRRKEFIPAGVNSEPDIFILSIINWDFRFQRPQHVAKELAQSGKRVFYVEMMLEPDGPEIRKINKNLYSVRLSSKGIGPVQPYITQMDEQQKLAWIEAFNSFCDAVEATSFKQIIIQHPFWWQMVRSIPPEFQLIHDCMDNISGFSNTNSFILDLEKDMIANCDMLIVSSQALFDKFKGIKLPRLIRNAADIDHFSSQNIRDTFPTKQNTPSFEILRASAETPETRIIKVGYVGAIAEWFDAALVRDIALDEPNFLFHLCGEVTDKNVKNLLQGIDNVLMYGEIDYVDVPSFLAQMDVLIIPFKIIPITEACDPVKFYEYSAMGKPTVATCLPELSRVSNLVFFASTSSELADQIRRAYEMSQDSNFRDTLRDYALQNTWRYRCNELTQALKDFPLVSIVILSYGDPELSKASIHSLFDGGLTYPNLEVLVVDNGSPPDSLDKIRSFASGYPDVEIIENGSNLGFAKGNNVGLTRAIGDYVMLLNNDTYVAPGAVHAMVRHLSNNPNIGAIGSLTNNIGNEAKITVKYSDMRQMKKVVRRITLGFRGRFFQVNSLAYFSVMFRRSDLDHFGLLPTDYGLGMFEDDDHCKTIHSKGYVTAVAEDGFVHHHLSASFDTLESSRRKALFENNKMIFEKKWGPWQKHQYRKRRPTKII